MVQIDQQQTTELMLLPIGQHGIGAGLDCDGQILVTHDMLGMTEMFHPRFVRRYLNIAELSKNAFRKYIKDVKNKKFPAKSESY